MKLPVKIHQPFGPYVLESICPKSIIDALNDKVDEVCSDPEKIKKYCSSKKNIPNLLLRDIEVVFFEEDFLDDIGFIDFIENLGNYYLKRSYSKISYDSVKVSIIPPGEKSFPLSKNIIYSDVWVNRYYKGDYTPYHDHGSDLAGIIVLKVPEDLNEVNMKNRDSEGDDAVGRSGGRVQFIHGGNFSYCCDEYTPHEQDEGALLIFPSWLPHQTNPLPVDSERRTLSFNLVRESDYYDRLHGN